jgi:hypothetical protein
MKKALDEGSSRNSASNPQNANCPKCIKLRNDIMVLRKELALLKNQRKAIQSAASQQNLPDGMDNLSLK